jgi:DNA-binding CsgD family transcriptional regulator
MARGRPKHDDVLTPREWEVVALIRAGLSNEQIAERLDITERTAKFHVSQILGKLGLPRRRDVARWQIDQKPSWQAIFVPLVLFRRLSTSVLSSKALAVAGGGVVLAAAGSLALFGALVLRQTVAPAAASQ